MKGTKEEEILDRINGTWTAQPNRRLTLDWKDKAKRLLGNRSIHVEGDGPFAVVTPCRNRAFSLWATRAEAEQAMNRISSCGGECLGSMGHYFAELGEPTQPETGQRSRPDQPGVKQFAKISID